MAKAKSLSRADQQLWAAFSANISLLPGRTRLPVEPDPAPVQPQPMTAPPRHARESGHLSRPVHLDAPPPGLDKASWAKLAGGKTRPAKRLDLHGHTAARAHHAVTGFIERAYAEQARCVEIITGKGAVLARELPLWLNAAPLRPLILAIAHPHAANTGSMLILLKRIR